MGSKYRVLALVATSLALLALGGVGASSAMAEEPLEQCSGANIAGQGSTLQLIAQEVWSSKPLVTGKGFNSSKNPTACEGVQGSKAKPTVTYTGTGSGAGQEVFGANLSGLKPSASGDSYVGSDEPLTETQMLEIDKEAGASSGGQTLVIPVAQAAVAIIVNPPAGCTITQITNEELLKVWNGEIKLWRELANAKPNGVGEACDSIITLIDRKDKSGTTFVFKSYLEEIKKGVKPCTSALLWKEYAEPAHNLEWPSVCGGTYKAATNSGGGGEAEEVEKTSGTMGYANLGDARKKYTDETGDHYHWLKLEKTFEAVKEFVNPGVSSGGEPSLTSGEANCKKSNYKLEFKGAKIEPGPDDNWSEVSGAHPSGNENYPICTLTYDVALVSYGTAGYTEANKIGTTTGDYLNYVVNEEGGQADFAKNDYGPVDAVVKTFAEEVAQQVGDNPVSFKVIPLKVFTLSTEQEVIVEADAGTGELNFLNLQAKILNEAGAEGGIFLNLATLDTCSLLVMLKKGESCKMVIENMGSHGLEWLELGRLLVHLEA